MPPQTIIIRAMPHSLKMAMHHVPESRARPANQAPVPASASARSSVSDEGLAVSRRCLGNAWALPGRCLGDAQTRSRRWIGRWPGRCPGGAWAMPWRCLGDARAMPRSTSLIVPVLVLVPVQVPLPVPDKPSYKVILYTYRLLVRTSCINKKAPNKDSLYK